MSPISVQNVRLWLIKKPIITILLVIALLAFALRSLIFSGASSASGPVANATYYFDTETGQVLALPAGQILPIRKPGSAPDAPATLVQAYIFSCASCDDEKSRFTGYLLTHNPAIVDQVRSHSKDIHQGVLLLHINESPEGILLKAIDPETKQPAGEWIPQKSPQGGLIVASVSRNCPDSTPALRCSP